MEANNRLDHQETMEQLIRLGKIEEGRVCQEELQRYASHRLMPQKMLNYSDF